MRIRKGADKAFVQVILILHVSDPGKDALRQYVLQDLAQQLGFPDPAYAGNDHFAAADDLGLQLVFFFLPAKKQPVLQRFPAQFAHPAGQADRLGEAGAAVSFLVHRKKRGELKGGVRPQACQTFVVHLRSEEGVQGQDGQAVSVKEYLLIRFSFKLRLLPQQVGEEALNGRGDIDIMMTDELAENEEPGVQQGGAVL